MEGSTVSDALYCGLITQINKHMCYVGLGSLSMKLTALELI